MRAGASEMEGEMESAQDAPSIQSGNEPDRRARNPLEVLQQRFGLTDFRAGQSAVIDRLLVGKNVAAVFPTGG